MGADVTYLHQQAPVGPSPSDQAQARRALTGACILGVLDHFGRRDHEAIGTSNASEVPLWELRRVVQRDDTGLHGCGFEYAISETINGAAAIPEDIRRCIVSAVSSEVEALYRQNEVTVSSWDPGLRSVMFGLEKHGADPSRGGTLAQLGDGALIFVAGNPPYALAEHLPNTRVPCRVHVPASKRYDQQDMPPALARLWQTDLFLGGAYVERTDAVRGVTEAERPTAWISASLKHPARVGTGGPGLQLIIETSEGLPRSKQKAIAEHSTRGDVPVLTLPAHGDFLVNFHWAFRTFMLGSAKNLPRRARPFYFNAEQGALVEWLSPRRNQPAIEVAHELLRGRPDLVSTISVAANSSTQATPVGIKTILAPLASPIDTCVA